MMGTLGTWGAGGGVFMIIFWALIAFAIVFLVKELTDSGKNRNSSRSDQTEGDALRILDKRFAKGEIDEEEYRKRKEEIAR